MKKILSNLFLFYLKEAAKIQLAKTKPQIIGITGSAGKTSLRQAIMAVLKDYFKVKQSIKANSETGLPLDILDLHLIDYSLKDWLRVALLIPWQILTDWQKNDYYLAEMGIDEPFSPKNMGYLLSFLKPQIAVFLNVGAVHSQQFEKIILPEKHFQADKLKQQFILKTIAKEKGKIITWLSKDKKAIVNIDDPLVLEQARQSKAKLYFFGCHSQGISQNELKIMGSKSSFQRTEFFYQYQKKQFSLKFNFWLADYYSYTFAAAILTGLALDISLEQIKTSLAENFVLPPGRMSCFAGIKKTVIIDSSYNASPQTVLGALSLLKKIKTKRKKVFVFGDMRELGSQAQNYHRQTSKEILKTVQEVVLIGPLTKKYVFPLITNKIFVEWFANSWQAADWLKNNLRGKEIILIKGSQNTIFTEIVVEKLLASKKDRIKLCRRGKFWHKQRQLMKK